MTEAIADAGTAVAALFDAHASAVLAYLVGRAGPDVGDDLVNDTFLTAYRRWSSFQPSRGTARAWLFGIATNELRHHWRGQGRQMTAYARLNPTDSAAEDPAEQTADRVDAAATARQLIPELNKLDPQELDILLLNAWAQLTPTEIAIALDLPAGTVRTKLRRTRRKLRDTIASTSPLLDAPVGQAHAD